MQVQEVVAKAVERRLVQGDWGSKEEVVPQLLEVQDHHSHHLPPDPAALADLAHSQEVEGH